MDAHEVTHNKQVAGHTHFKPRIKMSKLPTAISELPNLGPKSQAVLMSANIRSVAELRRLGAVAAFVRAKGCDSSVTLNLLWALEGALSGLPWQVVAREHRTSLLLALESYERGV